MTPPRSDFVLRTAAMVVGVVALLCALVPVLSALAGPGAATSLTTAASPSPALTASLLASSASVPTGRTFSYTADIRLPRGASYLQAVFEVVRPNGQIIFKRTKLGYGLAPGSKQHYVFSRDLTGPLALSPGEYPVKLTLEGTIQGSSVSTEVADVLRVYSAGGPDVQLALIAHIAGRPMSLPDGRFSVDPGQTTGARDAVSRVCRRVLRDPRAHLTLAVPPMLLAEWRRLSGGYTLEDGTVVRPDAPVAVAYNATLADLRAALDTGRLDLASAGYADPNLTDLADHGLTKDVGPQYDAGISAVFASLEVTPSDLTAPAGGCVPPNQVDILSQKGVRTLVVDDDCARIGKDQPVSGPYRLAHDEARALVVESTSTAALSRGDTEVAIDRAFVRLVKLPRQPLVMSIDVEGDSNPVTDTVSVALDAFEGQPWMQLVDADDVRATSSSASIRLVADGKTPHAPSGFWKTVAKARAYAAGYYAALSSNSTQASTAEVQSLVAEASSWSAPGNTWNSATRGLEYANASLKATRPALDGVQLRVETLTLSGSSGQVPITIVNNTQNTLSVVVRVSSTGGVRATGPRSFPVTLRPQENYIEVPVSMEQALDGKLVVEVRAGDLVLAHAKADVRASYLDRLAVVGAIVLIGAGVLVFIVRRVRSVPGAPAEEVAGSEKDWAEYNDDETSTR